MKKLPVVLVLAGLFAGLQSCDTLQQIASSAFSEPTLAEIAQGLKDALSKGIVKGANALAQRDGYYKSAYKILLPPEAQKVSMRLKSIPGFEQLEESLLEKINRGAEDAAKDAAPIFLNAIKAMTFQDASAILMGADNAATDYLQKTTHQTLYDKFKPTIVGSLNEVGANDLWRKAADAYNRIPLVTRVNNDLGDYITREALKGLFAKIAEEEKNIRHNPAARGTELLKKVFARQDANRK